jgi:hypothetical protein
MPWELEAHPGVDTSLIDAGRLIVPIIREHCAEA